MVSSRSIVAATATVAATIGVATPAFAGGAPVGPPTYPSLVNERLVRVNAALDRAAVSADEHQPNAAAATLMSARANLRKAWTSAQYVIQTAPPPVVVVDDRASAAVFHAKWFTRSGRLKLRKLPASTPATKKAHKSGAPVAAGAIASIYDTAFAVLSLQHRMATLSIGLLDTAHSTLQSSLSTSLFTALNERDKAIAYIKSIDIAPPPPVDDKPVAHKADDPAPTGWATVMPNLVPQLDDELQQVNGTIAAGSLRTGTRLVLLDALAQNTASEAAVNAGWPPAVPVDD